MKRKNHPGSPAMRSLLESTLGLSLRIFFRRIRVEGLENLSQDQPTVLALNHANGLIDPLLALCFLPRKVCFLGKAPLFKNPFIGWGVRALDTIPVYRVQDDPTLLSKNRETFDIARHRLASGLVLALFPEGVSHNDPGLKPLKTGLARIVLGAGLNDLVIVPVALAYSAKHSFRSSALMRIGAGIPIREFLQQDSAGSADVDRAAVRQVTDLVAQRLSALLDETLKEDIDPRPSPSLPSFGLMLLSPLAILGLLLNYPVYRIVGHLAHRLSGSEDDLIATFKMLGAILLFPLSWLVIASAVAFSAGWLWAQVALLLLPLLAWIALVFGESLDKPNRKMAK